MDLSLKRLKEILDEAKVSQKRYDKEIIEQGRMQKWNPVRKRVQEELQRQK